MSMVWARVSCPARMACSSTYSALGFSWAAWAARAAASRDTVSTVPSAGFITAP